MADKKGIKDSKDFIGSYLSWLKDNMTIKDLKENITELTTPFVDRHNDYIQVYIIRDSNGFMLTDDGYTIADLEISGLEFNTPKRKEILNTVLNSYGVSLKDGAITIRCDDSNFAICKHSLLQAILSVNDLFALSRNNIVSIFTEDVERFLNAHEIRFLADINLTGRSGFNYNFNFAIPKSKNAPERFLKVVNNPTKDMAKSIIFSWNDTKIVRTSEAKLYTFLNDEDYTVSLEIIKAFSEYEISVIRWTERDKYVKELSA